MTADILIPSYVHDATWLRYCLRSIKKFATGFSRVIVLVIREEEQVFKWVNEFDAEVRTYQRARPDQGMLWAMGIKCYAEQWCKSDFVVHFDSDTMLTGPATPATWFANCRPVLGMTPYAWYREHDADRPDYKFMAGWQAVTEKIVGFPVFYEYLPRHPQVHPISLYRPFREHVERVHRLPFRSVILNQKASFPWGFHEHNALGAYAHKFTPEAYQLWDSKGPEPLPPSPLRNGWSHGALPKEELERLLA